MVSKIQAAPVAFPPKSHCRSRWDARLHCFAGVLLLFFGSSHLAGFIFPGPSDSVISSVFPFLTNHLLFLGAAVLELALGTICIAFRARDFVNWAILGFVLSMIWYHWALAFTFGGDNSKCGCLGLFGRLFHASKSEQKMIPVITLTLMTLTVLPWLSRKILAQFNRKIKPINPAIVGIVLVLALHNLANGAQIIEVAGVYNVQHVNPLSGALYSTNQISFTYKVSGNAWSIFATNTVVSRDWEGLIWDGANQFWMRPNEGDRANEFPLRASVSSRQPFSRDANDLIDFDLIWVAYGLNPQSFPPNSKGIREIPLPWCESHQSPSGYGYEWKITPSDDGRFAAAFRILRNTNLDLSLEGELLRPDMNYPESLQMRNMVINSLSTRKQTEPDGFLNAEYKCSKWFSTNGVTLPLECEEKRYLFRSPKKQYEHPLFIGHVIASSLTVTEEAQGLLIDPPAKAAVLDYRYRKVMENGVYTRAAYSLNPGEKWKSADDPQILRNVRFQGFSRHHYLTARNLLPWIILLIAVFPLCFIVFKQIRQNKQTNIT